MKLFARRQDPSPRDAFKRAERMLRADYKVDAHSENDWSFARKGQTACLLTMWGYRVPDFEQPVYELPADGLVWDVAWRLKKRGLSDGALVLAKSAAGRGSVEMTKGDFLNPGEIFYYERKLTPVEFEAEGVKSFIAGCADAVERINRALRQDNSKQKK